MSKTKPVRIFATLLAALVLASGLVFAQSLPPNPNASRQAQFDEVLDRIVGPSSMDSSFADYDANLERLRTLLPPDDTARDIQFRSVYCGSDRWKDLEKALAYTDDAVKRAKAAGDIASQGRALFCRTSYISYLYGTKKAITDANTLVALLENSSERQLLSEALLQRGSMLSDLGEQAKALMDYQRARAGFRDAGIEHEVDSLMRRQAIAYRRIGDWPQAERYFKSALQRALDKGNWERAITNHIQLGYLYDESEQLQRSMAAFEQALSIATEHKDTLSIGSALLGVVTAQVRQGLFDDALATAPKASAALNEALKGGSNSQDMLTLQQGLALAGKGQYLQAIAQYRDVLPRIQKDGNERYLAMAYQALSESERALGRYKEALDDYKRYTDLQLGLQQKMRLEQSRLLEYEYEIRRRDFENQQLRTKASSQQQHLESLQRERRWQTLATALGIVLTLVLLALVWKQLRSARQLRTLAMTDPLTGTKSRRAIEAKLTQLLASATRKQEPMVTMMLDLDHFKNINDTYGHAAGDTVLRIVTRAWSNQLRDHDALGRYGGEEFVILCPGVDLTQAHTIANRLLKSTRALQMDAPASALRVTTSIGMTQVQPGDTQETVLARADSALYRAKQQGRDRVAL